MNSVIRGKGRGVPVGAEFAEEARSDSLEIEAEEEGEVENRYREQIVEGDEELAPQGLSLLIEEAAGCEQRVPMISASRKEPDAERRNVLFLKNPGMRRLWSRTRRAFPSSPEIGGRIPIASPEKSKDRSARSLSSPMTLHSPNWMICRSEFEDTASLKPDETGIKWIG